MLDDDNIDGAAQGCGAAGVSMPWKRWRRGRRRRANLMEFQVLETEPLRLRTYCIVAVVGFRSSAEERTRRRRRRRRRRRSERRRLRCCLDDAVARMKGGVVVLGC